MNCIQEINSEGFAIIDSIYTDDEIVKIIVEIDKVTEANSENSSFRKTEDLFAIRQFQKEIPNALNLIFNTKLRERIKQSFGADFFIAKSIYFDKPEKSNWFVAYHQDLTI
jgi:hypothetical protein